MKKTLLVIVGMIAGIISFAQPNNLDIGIFNNGANGSTTGNGAALELSLRARSTTYPASPVAEDYGVILRGPISDFSTADAVEIVQANAAIYGTAAVTVMTFQGAFDIGDGYIYFALALNNAGGMNLSPLTPLNAWKYSFTFKFSNAKTAAQNRMVRLVDQTNNAALSTFFGATVFTYLNLASVNQLTNAAITALPVNLLNFSGYKSGSKNVLKWTTANEQNNMGFEVQRSSDGVNYSAIGFVNSVAPGGISSGELNYSFDDNTPGTSKRNYYRLSQKDLDGRNRLSNIVVISGDKPTVIGIGGLFPNPASTLVNVIIDAPKRDKLTLVVMDAAGKTVKQQLVSVEIGSNTIPVEISNLAQGGYLVKVVCKEGCETTVAKFNKQ
jgi:hypothetical protein